MTEAPAAEQGDSVVALLSDVASDVNRLLRQEVELAKTEIRTEARKAATAGRLLVGGAMALHLVGIIASAAAVLAVTEVLTDAFPQLTKFAPAMAAGGIAVLWLIIGVVLVRTGSRRLRGISPVPQQTIQSLKEDLAWLRKPTA